MKKSTKIILGIVGALVIICGIIVYLTQHSGKCEVCGKFCWYRPYTVTIEGTSAKLCEECNQEILDIWVQKANDLREEYQKALEEATNMVIEEYQNLVNEMKAEYEKTYREMINTYMETYNEQLRRILGH